MLHHLRQIFRAPSPIHYLLLSLLTSYAVFVFWLGFRPIVLLSGGLIVTVAVISWGIVNPPAKAPPEPTDYNLLNPEVFFAQIQTITASLSAQQHTPQWQQADDDSATIHSIAVSISKQEPAFIPELLEALHTVVELVARLGQALETSQQVQTQSYQTRAKQQLAMSVLRLGQTRDRMQALYDQILVSNLERRSELTEMPFASTRIASQLQALITDNQSDLSTD